MAKDRFDYKDKDGWHVLAACGHYVSGSVKPGDKIALCPNCRLRARFKAVKITHPERLPEEFAA